MSIVNNSSSAVAFNTGALSARAVTKTIRDAYGDALVKYGALNTNVVALDADASNSTKSVKFAQAFPERFFNVGIAEQNMMGMAAGLAAAGKIPFVNTFAIFLCTLGSLSARSLIAYSGLNVKLMGAYGGLSDAFDGASHHAIEDLAVFRAIPGFRVFVASDAAITDWLVKTAINEDGPMYIRLSREAMPGVYSDDERFEIGKGKIVREGTDATLFACGLMVSEGLKAAATLAGEGVSLRVVDLFTIKPIDRELILRCAEETRAIITAEEHNILGGLGGAVAEVLATGGAQAKLEMVGVRDVFTETGPYAQLLRKFDIDAQAIVAAVKRALT